VLQPRSNGGASGLGLRPAAEEARRLVGCLPFAVGGGDGEERVDNVLKKRGGGLVSSGRGRRAKANFSMLCQRANKGAHRSYVPVIAVNYHRIRQLPHSLPLSRLFAPGSPYPRAL
jgi:hypothetical protein